MSWLKIIVLFSVTSASLAINRPVYKIVLKQKGYAQFLQYDIETPPIREFTFCTWIRVYDLASDQSIFTYVANGNNRVVRLWLDSGGRNINVSINGRAFSSHVDVTKDVWRHICLSYQSDYGAWAIYLDSRLIACQTTQALLGYAVPGGGSVIIGYGTAENGSANGLEGEIFGANMILVSTIERNHTVKNNPYFEQKRFQNNKMKFNGQNINYIVLSDLQTGELVNTFESTKSPSNLNPGKSFIQVRTPHSSIEHVVGFEKSTKKKPIGTEKEYSLPKFIPSTAIAVTPELEYSTASFWNYSNPNPWEDYLNSKFYKSQKIDSLINTSINHEIKPISEYETPPPPKPHNVLDKTLETEKQFSAQSFYQINTEPDKKTFENNNPQEISEVETPPSEEKNKKKYNQWTSSQFAGSVLNYLKNVQFRTKEQKKVPQTIPLTKFSDSFPYASEFKLVKLRPPSQFQRRSLVEKQFGNSKRIPQINVQILEDDLRHNILKSHAQTQPRQVEISIRGKPKKKNDYRFYRNVEIEEESEQSLEIAETTPTSKPILRTLTSKNKQNAAELAIQRDKFKSILPFLKSLENFIESGESQFTNKDDIYTKMLSESNQWHNVKSFSNYNTPREIKFDAEDGQSIINEKIAQIKKRHPSLRLKYSNENQKVVQFNDDKAIVNGRQLAIQVSNQADNNINPVSILKYNHGFLPEHKTILPQKHMKKHNFNKHVKIGNALNERQVIGNNKEQNIQSFLGGDEAIPDINKYRSDIDGENMETSVPGSLVPRVCKNIELYDRVLYIQPDESIDMTHIMSPVRGVNVGIEFVIENYKKCSLQESELRNNKMLYIDWSVTPVRLFGGAYPKKTTDLCGFF